MGAFSFDFVRAGAGSDADDAHRLSTTRTRRNERKSLRRLSRARLHRLRLPDRAGSCRWPSSCAASLVWARSDRWRQLEALPPEISYTLLRLSDGTRLPRRDLFDVRFQQALLDDLQSDRSALLQGVSDVEAGLYEGGLKCGMLWRSFLTVYRSWECSLDLIDVLARSKTGALGRTVCEVRMRDHRRAHRCQIGCGTALPSCYLFNRLLASSAEPRSTSLVLQDYDAEGSLRRSLHR